jgi:hypothetical protein
MATTCNGYDASIGYVEVYGVAAMTFTDKDGNTLTGPISKGLIQTAYSTLYNGTSGVSFLYNDNGEPDPMGGHATCVNFGTMPVPYSDKTYGMKYYPSQNVLAGVEEVKDPSMNLVMPMVATALANNCNTQRVSIFAETRWDLYGYNSEFEVRAALAKSAIHIPYRNDDSNSTFAVFNFPAKLSCCESGGTACDGVLTTNDPCDKSKDYATSIAQNIYDLQENTTTTTIIYSPAPPGSKIEKEVYIGKLTPPFAEGWMRVQLTDAAVQSGTDTNHTATTQSGDRIRYVGSAVIPSYLQAAYDMTWVPATFDCSDVKVVSSPDNATFNNCAYQLTPNKMLNIIVH